MAALGQRELQRAVLARQGLLDRLCLPLPDALARVAYIQAQYAPSMYIGLWSRVDGFERDSLTRALAAREVVQATLMRLTIHLMPRDDYWPAAVATRAARQLTWLRARRHDPNAAQMEEAAAIVRKALVDGPLRRSELDALIGKARAPGVGNWVDMVRVPPSGTWERRRADLYGLAADWLGPNAVSAETGVELLVRRYLAGFGPATRAEIANWAGLSVTAIKPALDRLDLVRHRSASGDELLDLPGAPLPDPETPAPVRFLPTWDAALLVHCRRTQILPEEYRRRVFNIKMPASIGTFLVDGTVAGTWRYAGGRVTTELFTKLDRAAARELEAEAERLAAFHS